MEEGKTRRVKDHLQVKQVWILKKGEELGLSSRAGKAGSTVFNRKARGLLLPGN